MNPEPYYRKYKNTFLIQCDLVQQLGYDCPYATRIKDKDICTADHCQNFLEKSSIKNNNETMEKNLRLCKQRNPEEIK